MILLLKHLSLVLGFPNCFAAGPQELLEDARGRVSRVTHTFHLYQLCSYLFYCVDSHTISFVKKEFHSANKTNKNIFPLIKTSYKNIFLLVFLLILLASWWMFSICGLISS